MIFAGIPVQNFADGCDDNRSDNLIRALQHAHSINEHLPSHAVVIDALDTAARGFYQQFGYEALDTHPQGTRLFLSMQLVSQVFAA